METSFKDIISRLKEAKEEIETNKTQVNLGYYLAKEKVESEEAEDVGMNIYITNIK